MSADPTALVRPLNHADMPAWRGFRQALWPQIEDAENLEESEAISVDPAYIVFVTESNGALTGFIEVRLREYADGCSTRPVGFIEGWYVVPDARGAGVGRALVAAAEQWARSNGCTEMASDALLDNTGSQRAHERLGYTEVERAVRFRKDLR